MMKRFIGAVCVMMLFYGFSSYSFAQAVSPALKNKLDVYKGELAEWAADPVVISAAKSENSVTFTNDQWKTMSPADPRVLAYQESSIGRVLSGQADDSRLEKLFLRDAQGNYKGGNRKPALYNIKDRNVYKQTMTGQVWASPGAKPDPTTEVNSIQIGAPVKDGGKVIGVLHTSLAAE